MNGVRRSLHVLARVGYLLVFAGLLLAIAFGSAGIVALWAHPPGTAARAELTWQGDTQLGAMLDRSQVDLVSIAEKTDRLAVLARGAIGALTADDQGPFSDALTEGSALASSIERDSGSLRERLTSLPGAGTFDVLRYDGGVLARRVGLLAALDATRGLGRSWATLTTGSLQASALIGLLVAHDTTVGRAAAQGRAANYEAALATLDMAIARLDDAVVIRDRLANTTDVSTLDQWIERNRRYDEVLTALYGALRDSGGVLTDAVRAARQDESNARAALPPDTRGLVVIIADIGRGGLNQAVIAIDQARARLTLAIQALSAP
ncbi:MAG: hypothetical protein HYX54_08520 [Chloroflexi bacterium]|nr:hypothetical protein [Chloroflexota bacterium]